MKSIDTNVAIRIITADDPAQTRVAVDLIESGVPLFVSLTVTLETEWVLRSAYRWPSDRIADALTAFASLHNIQVEERERVAWAIDRLRGGADFSDMIHLVAARGTDSFVTFDRKLLAEVDLNAPVEVEILA